MNRNFLLGFGAGILGVYLWNQYRKKAIKPTSEMTIKDAVAIAKDVVAEESGKFSDAVKEQYNIIMPSDLVSKRVKKKAAKLTEGRFAIQEDKIKEPVNL